MENNIENNDNKINTIKKNNKLMTVIVIVIVLAILAIVALKTNEKKEIVPLTQSEIDLNKAATLDTTESIKTNIDNINVTDTTDADLQSVDQNLKNL
jgi:preprotein translocase subunit SecF